MPRTAYLRLCNRKHELRRHGKDVDHTPKHSFWAFERLDSVHISDSDLLDGSRVQPNSAGYRAGHTLSVILLVPYKSVYSNFFSADHLDSGNLRRRAS